MHRSLFLVLFTLVFFAADLAAQRPDRPRRGGGGGGDDSSESGAKGGSESKKTGPKDYDEVIKEDFVTDPGLFLVHRGDEKACM